MCIGVCTGAVEVSCSTIARTHLDLRVPCPPVLPGAPIQCPHATRTRSSASTSQSKMPYT
eukprot:6201940-Pleurochrysis_carterae.AAC.2